MDIYSIMLSRAVAVTLVEKKVCSRIKSDCLSLLAEMFRNMFMTIGRMVRAFAEHNGRVEPALCDVMAAFATLGISVTGLQMYARRQGRTVTLMPPKATNVRPSTMLRVVPYQPHKSHIPKYLPPLPDMHTYLWTNARQKPETSYVQLREKSSTQRSQLGNALSRFLANSSNALNLLGDNSPDKRFMVAVPQPKFPSYLSAILPTDQEFDFDELEYFYQAASTNWPLLKRAQPPLAQTEIDNPYLKKPRICERDSIAASTCQTAVEEEQEIWEEKKKEEKEKEN